MNTITNARFRALISDRETSRDAIAECTANPDHAMAYFLPGAWETFANADRELRALVAAQRAAGLVLCPISLEWRESGDTLEDYAAETAALDRESRASEAAQERAASQACDRAYGGSVD